jgi:hypothetical protein
MLNRNLVLDFIKQNLAYPFQVLEMSDNDINEYITTYILRRFSRYLPDIVRKGMNFADPKIRTKRENEYYLFDDEGCSIIGLVDFIPVMGGMISAGHPIIGVMSFEEVEKYVYDIEISRNTLRYGFLEYEADFIPPNIIRIEPSYREYGVVIYERVHPEDLSTIPVWAEDLFLDYCLGHIQVLLGNKRKKFQNIQTPYGEVPLNADEIKSDGKELIQKVEEDLKTYNPSIIIDIG